MEKEKLKMLKIMEKKNHQTTPPPTHPPKKKVGLEEGDRAQVHAVTS